MRTIFYLMSKLFIGLIVILTLPFSFVYFFSDGAAIKIFIIAFYLLAIVSLILIEQFALHRRIKILKLAKENKDNNFKPNIEIESAFSNRYIGIDSLKNNMIYIDDDTKKIEHLKTTSIIKWEIERDGMYPLLTFYLNNANVPFIKIRIRKNEKDKYLSNIRSAFP